ncbi:MAG: asparagine synthase-related protein, partial [Woeseiaceae bacterium]
MRTFNLSFDEVEYDESVYARAVAQTLGTDHTEARLTQMQFKSQLHAALSSIDQPTFDAINSYFVSRAVREAGMTVA